MPSDGAHMPYLPGMLPGSARSWDELFNPPKHKGGPPPGWKSNGHGVWTKLPAPNKRETE